MKKRPYGIRRARDWSSWEHHKNPKGDDLNPLRFTKEEAKIELAKLPTNANLRHSFNWHSYLIS